MPDPRTLDAAYQSFPSFEEWAGYGVDHVRWERFTRLLALRSQASPDELRRARDIVRRAAAVDTGALEDLYEVDGGFTLTIATQAATWEAALDARGPRTRALIESQLNAYEYVLDAATHREPITEAWIRTLHIELCRSQETYSARTEVGFQEQPLPIGKYKHHPNHVQLPGGAFHAYAPVDRVPAEMHRLVETLRSEAFEAAHPVLQASYAHYAFVLIHPFADGNGRVSRGLASIFTYRSHGVPLLILSDNREEYLEALRAADRGDRQAFVDFVFERVLDAITMVDESLKAVGAPAPADARAALDALYRTQGGYTQEEVDAAAWELVSLFRDELRARASLLSDEKRLTISIGSSSGSSPTLRPGYRVPVSDKSGAPMLTLHAGPPAEESLRFRFLPAVPRDAGQEDDVEILNLDRDGRGEFAARLTELRPRIGIALKMRLRIATERIVSEAIVELVDRVRVRLNSAP